MNLGVGDGVADGNRVERRVGVTSPPGDVNRGLRRSIEIVELGREHGEHTILKRARKRFAGADDPLYRLAPTDGRLLYEQLEHRRHKMESGDRMALDCLRQIGGVPMAAGFGHNKPSTDL